MNTSLIPYLPELPQSSHASFLTALDKQLSKDLYPCSWVESTHSASAEEIISKLKEAIAELINVHHASLGNVLYRIDVPEGPIRALMACTEPSERVSVLASAILKREAKKVWMRMIYSTGEGKSPG